MAAAFACLAAGAVAIGAALPADAAKPKEIGKTKRTPGPSCPTPSNPPFPDRKGCQVLGEVTGFQVRADDKHGLMKAPADGSIVAWSVDLARPNKDERNFFEDVLGNEAFDGAPSARLALLTHSSEKKFRLRARSPVEKLTRLMGRRQYFTLNQPIEVEKGWISAITTETWVPNFAHDLHGDDLWKASRTKSRCEGEANLTKHSHPHKGVGTIRRYGCGYEDARLIYWSYFRPS